MTTRVPMVALLASFLFTAPLIGQGQPPTLQPRLLLGDRVSILLPADFTPMPQEMIVKKYPNANRPNLVFTNQLGSINVAIEHTQHRLPAADLAKAHESVRQAFKNMYPSAHWFRDEMKEINGRRFFLVELRTPAIDTEIRNIMAGTSFDDRLLMVTFNVTKALEDAWIASGHLIIDSINVK